MDINLRVLPALLLAGSAMLASCNSNTSARQVEGSNATDSAAISQEAAPASYGNYDGQEIRQYTLKNAAGTTVKILNYGGIITDIITADKNGEKGNVVLSYDDLAGYQQKGQPYFGALIGRYANRIAQAKFKLDGKEYPLAANDHANTLHGGIKGFDKVVWNAEQAGDSSLRLTYLSKDGEEGYPGNLQTSITYTLTPANALQIQYQATTDKPTPINLTNHTYFNLSAGKDSTILGQELSLKASRYTPVNDQLIPDGRLQPVKGTPMDFTNPKKIGAEIAQVKGGYDHNWVLDKKEGVLETIGSLYDPNSGRLMEVATTEPGIQFYTGNFLDGTLTHTRDGKKYVQHAGLCLETQHFPDSPNQPAFPKVILKPGETYTQTTVYTFSTK
ncbi:aldose epimerase family protein [Chitinophaga nivalis]|uniref:Aldose 1-epimerase n=1 Tax=Chitinophaga nivalis TaxID=2991709 RepID=A0ABT3IHZ4_9BACT|nr:aldose epimerase family protein [Chitinophaga nivalis]MCW3466940.1 galactose mutarotase [Chitinophaga nivalis]MCW3483369.1 galactose mutarotase [Chitinophaga nivalis]